ncbi:fibronectin type III domain-containing protein [Bacillus spongiae]|uniref:Fibronectin type III domain-containing protein n=1 Tax=Bacillus spongiae TaxID=2683610 RepID=A0ABU8HEW4_9BACI
MPYKIQIKSCLKEELSVLDIGEFCFCIDTNELFIGTDKGNELLANKRDIPSTLIIEESASNGFIVVNGAELKVFDEKGWFEQLGSKADRTELENKAEVVHTHNLSEVKDVDIKAREDGFALLYDNSEGKFVSKALPTESGATSLGELLDVDLTTPLPIDDDVLTFKNGIWKASALTGSVITENFVNGELVELPTTSPPEEVNNFVVTTITRTSLTLKWSPSLSSNVMTYNIYHDNVLIDTLEYIQLEKVVDDLSVYTEYTFRITTVDDYGNESPGIIVNARTEGYSLKLDGLPNSYLKTPILAHDEVIFEFKVQKKPNVTNYYLDSRLTMPNSHVRTNSSGNDSVGAFYNRVYVDDVEVNTSSTPWIPEAVFTEVRLVDESGNNYMASTTIFANALGPSDISKGEIKRIRLLKEGIIVADYDFGTGTYADQSGNDNTLLHIAGVFI